MVTFHKRRHDFFCPADSAMSDFQPILSNFVLLWAVIDPIGTVPVFISATRSHNAADRTPHRAAWPRRSPPASCCSSSSSARSVLNAMGVPILAFQISGGIVLFLFALTMIFGESKPEAEAKDIRQSHDVAIFPLATPSIASPGAMMAVVLHDAERPPHDRRTNRHDGADARRRRRRLPA